MKKIDLKHFFSLDPKIIYPLKIIEIAKEAPTKSVIAFTSSVNNYIIPSLMIICDGDEREYFNIGYPPPKPLLKYRMLDLVNKDFLIEIVLYFENQRNLKLQLNPLNKIVRHYLNTALKTNIVGFHFYIQKEDVIISTMTNVDEEELDWFNRNYRLSKKLKKNLKYNVLSNIVKNTMTDYENERCYKFHRVDSNEILIENSTRNFIMENEKTYKNFDDTNEILDID